MTRSRSAKSVPLVTRATLAKVLGVSVRQTSQLEADGIIGPVRRGRAGRASTFDLVDVVPRYIGHLTAAKPTSPREAFWRARASREELELARQTGGHISRDQVVFEGRAFVRAWCAVLERLPHTVRVAGADAEIVHLLTTEIRRLRTEIASWKVIADLERSIAQSPPHTAQSTPERTQ